MGTAPDGRAPLTRATPTGWVRWAFWFLRLYIALMLAAVVVGFLRGRL
jgi:hypothetical protein